jgi:predicted nucleotidyltransferase
MDVANPIAAVSPSLEGEVLRVLSGTTTGLTGRQVAAMTGRSSHSGVLDALHRLADQGLVNKVELNRAYLFSLNREHLAADAVMELAGLRTKLVNELRRVVAAWEVAPVHVSLFGSTARGDGDAHSDIDLLAVRPEAVAHEDEIWNGQLDELRESIQRWTGNTASLHVHAEQEIARLRVDRPPIVAELLSDSILIAGISASEMLDRP